MGMRMLVGVQISVSMRIRSRMLMASGLGCSGNHPGLLYYNITLVH